MYQQDKPKTAVIVAFSTVLALLLVLVGSFIGISALNWYLQNNNYVLCSVDDLKKSNDILNGERPLKYLPNMTRYSEQGLLNETVPKVITWER